MKNSFFSCMPPIIILQFIPQSYYCGSLVPSGSPSNVGVTELGDNQIRVSWTPPTDATRYVVTYGTAGSNVSSVSIEGAGSTGATLVDLEAEVEYEIRVQGFADLPGLASEAVMVVLDGKGTLV